VQETYAKALKGFSLSRKVPARASHNITPEFELLRLENSQSLSDALAGLPFPYREMILLSDIPHF
jgi:DNA-directed RNA polymerase specialized sigma24 family protein